MGARTTVTHFWRHPLPRVGLSLAILGWLLASLPTADLWASLRALSPLVWLFALLVFLAGHLAGVLKWRLLVNAQLPVLTVGRAVRCHFAGLFANLFLPSVSGGDVVRAGLALRGHSAQEAVVVGSLLDRFLDLLALLILVGLGALFAPGALLAQDRRFVTLAALLLVGVGVAGGLFLLLPLPRWAPRRVAGPWRRVRGIVGHLLRQPQRALLGLAVAVVVQGIFVLLSVLLADAIGIELPLAVWFLAWPLAKLSATLPISIGGLGVREAALAALLGRFGVAAASAVALGLLWQTVLVAGGAVGGLFYVTSRHELGGPVAPRPAGAPSHAAD